MSRERTNPRETAQFSQANEAGGSSSIHAPREAGPHPEREQLLYFLE